MKINKREGKSMKTNRKTILVLLPIVIVMIAMLAVGIVNPKMLKEAPIIKWARQALGEDIVIRCREREWNESEI